MSDSTHQPIDWPRLGRYVAGECAAPEADEIRHWIEADPARADLIASIRAIWEAGAELPSTGTVPPTDEERAWRTMRARIAGLGLGNAPRRPVMAPLVTSRAAGWQIAAAVLLTATAGLVWQLRSHPTPVATPQSWREVGTGRGQRATIRLGEGTTIMLGVASKLRYREPYVGGKRDAYLEGEAYFDVTHDPKRPFVVHAGNAVASDLGTTFGIRAYAGDRAVRVVVARGKVSLHPASAESGAVLTDRSVGVVDSAGSVRVTPDVRVESYLGWTRGELAFARAPLGAVLAELARWYDVDFELADAELAARPVTLIVRQDALEHVLDGLALLVDARYERQGRVVTFFRSHRTS